MNNFMKLAQVAKNEADLLAKNEATTQLMFLQAVDLLVVGQPLQISLPSFDPRDANTVFKMVKNAEGIVTLQSGTVVIASYDSIQRMKKIFNQNLTFNVANYLMKEA